MGLELSINLKQLPEKKLIYKNKYVEYTTPEAFQSPDGFAEVLKKVITQFTADMDRLFEKFTKEGNLPVNLSGKNVICAVFQFKDTIEGEKYGDPLASMMMISYQDFKYKGCGKGKNSKAIKELEFRHRGSLTHQLLRKLENFSMLIFWYMERFQR